MRTRQLNKYSSGFALWLFVAGATTLLGGQAKVHSRPVGKPGVVSGRVFLITVAGDLKPARMAKVILLFDYEHNDAMKYPGEYENSVGHEWGEETVKAVNQMVDESTKESAEFDKEMAESEKASKEGKTVSELPSPPHSDTCRMSLAAYSSALSRTLDWAAANKKGWQVVIGQADEDGNFRIPVPHRGAYSVVVFGHAGFNDAFWEPKDAVIINPGEETTIKLASPEEACVGTK